VSRTGASRLRLLQALREAPHALGVADLAEDVGLHPNTVRFHLGRLVREGLALRRVEARSEPGRPRLVFSAASVPEEQRDGRGYRLLAEILAGFVAGTSPAAATAATEAGRAWGRYLTERPAPYRRSSEEAAQRELLRLLSEIGFVAELERGDSGSRVLLRHCPFLEVAEVHREVVCSVHLGLMQGALAELRAPITAERLEPFVEPSLCVASLTRREPVPRATR
jgi:predicted ArsR family transcriptional regulator